MTDLLDRVVVWWSAQVPARSHLTALESVLDPAEREKANRFQCERDRLRFTWRRVLRRKVLAAITGVPPAALRFSNVCTLCGDPAHGKPSLAESGAPCFSASQSGAITAIALCDRELGLDVLCLQQDLSFIAGHALKDSEERALPEPGPQRQRALALLWARKEAYLKGIGWGLSIELADFSVLGSGFSNGEAARIVTAVALPRWWTISWVRLEGWAVAVSSESSKAVEFRAVPAAFYSA